MGLSLGLALNAASMGPGQGGGLPAPPPLVHDLTSGLPPGSSFARADEGTAWAEASPPLRVFATDVPRLTAKGVLLEASATNLGLYSWTTTNGWVPTNGTRVSGQPDPAGGTAAALFTPATTTALHYMLLPSAAVVSGTAYVQSLLVKAGTADQVQLAFSSFRYGGGPFANFQLAGAGRVLLLGGSATAAGILNVGDGWYLLHVAATCTSSGSNSSPVSPLTTGEEGRLPTTTGPGTLVMVGAQLEAWDGVGPTSPIITGAAAQTRGADVWSCLVPTGYTQMRVTYGPEDSQSTLGVSAGASVDMVTARPWVGLGHEPRRLEFLS